MSDTPGAPPASVNCVTPDPLRPDAVRVEGATRRGRPCALVDNTGDALPRAELESLLADLVAADAFGFRAASAAGGDTLDLDAPQAAHVQIAGRLYRLLVHRFEARLEPF